MNVKQLLRFGGVGVLDAVTFVFSGAHRSLRHYVGTLGSRPRLLGQFAEGDNTVPVRRLYQLPSASFHDSLVATERVTTSVPLGVYGFGVIASEADDCG